MCKIEGNADVKECVVTEFSYLLGNIKFLNNRFRFSPRNIGCLLALSTSAYQPPRTIVRSSFYPLLWWPIFSS
jgi:hypothetical protein